jgi:hypothetical protein
MIPAHRIGVGYRWIYLSRTHTATTTSCITVPPITGLWSINFERESVQYSFEATVHGPIQRVIVGFGS